MIKFPIKVDLAMTAHKVSLMIQAALGGLDLHKEDRFKKLRPNYIVEENIIFQHVHRLIRCIVDCQLTLEDSAGVRSALELSRSLAARAWDDSPFQLTQLEGIGPVSVRKLVNAGIRSIEDLNDTEPHKIEMVLVKNPPFGRHMVEKTKTFPRLHVALKKMGMNSTASNSVKVRAEIGFMNDHVPLSFMNKTIYVCLLAETSDGKVLHFCRLA